MSKLKVQHVDTRHPRGTLFIGHDGSTTHFHPHSRVILHEYATQDWVRQYISDELDLDLEELLTKREAYDTFPAIHISRFEPVDEIIHLNDFWICTDPDAKATHVCTGIERDDDGVAIKYHWRKFVPSPDLDDDVAKIKTDIVELQGELDSIIQTSEKGEWEVREAGKEYVNGSVVFENMIFSSPQNTVTVSTTDDSSEAHTFASAQVGDYLEIIEDDEDYLLGIITEKNVDENYNSFVEFKIDMDRSAGNAEIGNKARIRSFKASLGFETGYFLALDGSSDMKGENATITWDQDDRPDDNLDNKAAIDATGMKIQATRFDVPWGGGFYTQNAYRMTFNSSNTTLGYQGSTKLTINSGVQTAGSFFQIYGRKSNSNYATTSGSLGSLIEVTTQPSGQAGYARYYGSIANNNDIATKKYVTDNKVTNHVTTDSNQSSLNGNKTWTGAHTFNSTAAVIKSGSTSTKGCLYQYNGNLYYNPH